MSTENTRKIKLLKIMELLRREFNEEHPISGIEIMERLEDQGISGSERSITRDIDTLNEYGFGVMYCQLGHQKGYYVKKRDFDVAEIRPLMDAVQAAGFISEEKTQELIGKIANLNGCFRGSIQDSGDLQEIFSVMLSVVMSVMSRTASMPTGKFRRLPH